MISLPKLTKIVKNIPKNSFYEKADMSSAVKKKFVDYVVSIYLVNKLSPDTLNIKSTKNVEEIFVFQIKLKDVKYLDKIEDVLSVIDKSVPYPILFVLIVDDQEVMYKIAYKQKNKIDDNKSVIETYLSKDILELKDNLYNSLNLEILYERILRLFLNVDDNIEIVEAIHQYKSKEYLKKELEILEKKVVREKQPDKQYSIYNKITNIKKELKNYNL